VRELTGDNDAFNRRIGDLDARIAALLEEHGNPSPTCLAPATRSPPA
jgi:hypothetical protein